MLTRPLIHHGLLLSGLALGLIGCGGPASQQSTSTPTPTPPTTVFNGVIVPEASSRYAQQCAASNPHRNEADSPAKAGTLESEKRWVRGYMHEAYLWYHDVPDVQANQPQFSDSSAVVSSLDNYFEALKSPYFTASGKRKDEFSFTYPTKAWNDLSVSGKQLSYGVEWYYSSRTPPRNIRIAYIEPGSPAESAGLRRGDTLQSINGISADTSDNASLDRLNAALFPQSESSASFVFSRNGSNLPSISMAARQITKKPVLLEKTLNIDGQKIGYIVFNDHIATAESQLISAFGRMQQEGVSDLVLDLRYNGGGYLYLAEQIGYMVAGPERTQGKVFERLQFNDKRKQETAESVDYFRNTACQPDSKFNCTSSQTLPTLRLSRLFVLVSGATCSASEAIINGLRGVDLDVRLIGSTTCGKPYGFYGQDNCGISYFPMEFQGVNAKGFGDYADGFSPQCQASDDFSTALGDPSEGMLATALYNRAKNSCPSSARGRPSLSKGFILRGPERENAIRVRSLFTK